MIKVLTFWENFNWDYQTPYPNPTEYINPDDGEVWLLQGPLPGDPTPEHHRRMIAQMLRQPPNGHRGPPQRIVDVDSETGN